ncbi:ribonuclease 1-like [Tripterygium wilfordii]|uniref:ribonuclease 1-like n=1 Tax=Tripterygium wilfordii TaxID=458696 RepID=UPI0018F856AF|nr:ribonuclease 1-like [Tripterygium wilfordii]
MEKSYKKRQTYFGIRRRRPQITNRQASVLLAKSNAKPEGPFDFYRISLQWPESYCNHIGVVCQLPILSYFTIHGVWPQYNPDIPVPAFNKSGCNTIQPTPSDAITDIDAACTLGPFRSARFALTALLDSASILSDMTTYWPNIKKYTKAVQNLKFWQNEWQKHGMCFAYPDQPILFFQTALNYIKHHNFLEILRKSVPSIVAHNDKDYDRNDIANAITNSTGVSPEILCNRDAQKRDQLLEIRICFYRSNTLMDCPQQFLGELAVITFPRKLGLPGFQGLQIVNIKVRLVESIVDILGV